ncbi:phytoene desaturase family protein [Alphaproteobacteria bacterium]|nr:phytoene desaturase family protein [Alphaproteobacteria bacterium]
MTTNKKALIIGSGFGGIASALRLKKIGFEVTLVERLDMLGGRARVFQKGGYRHDAGPTVITAPFLFEELFELYNKNLKDHLNFVPLDPWYRFYFHNGKTFNYRPSIDDTNKEIEKFDARDVQGYRDLLETSKDIFKIGFEKLSDQPFSSFWEMAKQAPSLVKLKSYLTVGQLVNSKLKNEFLRKAFSIHPLLVGGNPFTTTSIYALIHYLERKWGVFFCMGGTGKIVQELERLMIENDITVKKNTDITKIKVKSNRATGVITSTGDEIDADVVICNADPPTVYKEMLDPQFSKKALIKPEKFTQYSMGLYVLFFGSKKQYPSVAHHTIWMAERYKELLNDIFDKRILTKDFSLYLHRPTATDETFAPTGKDSFYVLCPVPNLKADIDWEKEGPRLRDKIVNALSETIMPDLEKNIEEDFWMTPQDFKNDYRSMHGAGFSIAPIFSQSAWFRYHNKDKKISNLYFSTAGSHPGAGIPGVLCSAKVVEKLIKKDFNIT